MDVATVMGIVQSLLTAIQCSDQLKKMCSHFRYKYELQSLQRSLNTICAVLEDADAKQGVLTRQDKLYLEELRDVVYDADDVLDEFFTLIQRKKIPQDGGSLFDKVTSFFSRFKPLAINISKKVDNVRRKLDAIATNRNQFRVDVDDQLPRFRKEETCSYVFADDIIGRENDMEKILCMLLDSNSERDISCLTIVGIGGLGKTALTQLVFNHEKVKSAFPLRLWTCVSDENPEHLDVEATLRKILASATDCKEYNITFEGVQRRLRGDLGQKKYLLVLDDVWSENYDDWMKLMGFLKGGGKGSWILVTTRSRQTASVVGNGPTHMLPGLSEQNSWRLFRRAAFGTEEPNPSSDDLVRIGREIVKRCANVPLAIRVIGSLLYGQPQRKWLSFEENGLANVEEDENGIKPILKLSYYNLKYPLKSCFRYCALFPKDCVIYKENLINLWKAQGYIFPEKGEDIEDVAEQYFLTLLRRCFFQDVKKDEVGEILSCKIHDLLHDIAQDESRNEICLASGHTINLGDKVRHLNLTEAEHVHFSGKQNSLRTCIVASLGNLILDKLVQKSTCLRTLDLSCVGIASLPDSLGNLFHLRYLNLSRNKKLEVLPKSVTKLYNLQTLDLRFCPSLKGLPKNVGKLVNLSTLNITFCQGLTCMPSSLGKLTSLHTLGRFVVRPDSTSGEQCCDVLEALKPLNNLKGHLDIHIWVPEKWKLVKKDESQDQAYLERKERLDTVFINFRNVPGERCSENEEVLLEQLRPHSNLKQLFLEGYHGVRMPRWPSGDEFSHGLPNLVTLEIDLCRELRWLPSMGRLPHLKHLRLMRLPKLEYVEFEEPEAAATSKEASSYFPCLESLELRKIWNLKGWWGKLGSELVQNDELTNVVSDHQGRASHPCLPHVKQLHIKDCPGMTGIPWCPLVKRLIVSNSISCLILQVEKIPSSSSYQSSSALHSEAYTEPMELLIRDFGVLKSMPMEYLQCLTGMVLKDEMVESLAEVKELPILILSSLRSLEIHRCSNLRSICGWIEHLTALERLCIRECGNLVKNGVTEEIDGIPWRYFPPNLRSLCWEHMGSVPDGMQYCTSLHSLEIRGCGEMESLPQWVPKLASLTHLQLEGCSERLHERCQKDTGEDWPLIQHISDFYIFL